MEPGASFSPARRAQLEELCDDLIERALRVHAAFHGSASALDAWKLVRRRDALSVYRLRHEPRELDKLLSGDDEGDVPAVLGSPSSSSSSSSDQRSRARSRSRGRGKRQRLLLGSGIVRGSADDAIAGVYCDSTESLRVVKRLINDSFIDGAVLHVFERNPLHAPVVFSGVKWFALKGVGNGQLVRDRDFLTYERMGRILDHRSGQVFTYQVLQSIDLPERPANRDNVARAHMSWCYLYRQLDPEWLGCFMLGDLDIGGGMEAGPKLTVPRPIDDFVSAERLLTAANFRVVVRARAFSRLISSSADLLPSEATKHCDRCMSSVTKLFGQSLTLCMGCKKNVCRTCRRRETVFRLKTRTGKPEREYFCRGCVDSVDGMRAALGASSIASSGYSHSMPTSEHHGSSSKTARRGRETSGDSNSPSSASSLSPTQEWSELDDEFLSEDEEGPSGYTRSYHADDKELRKLASFTRRCSIVEDAREHHAGSNNQRATSKPIPGGIWWNPKEMERLARYLSKEKRRERRRRGDTDYDRPRSSSDRHYASVEGSTASSHPRDRGTDSVYSGVSSYGTDRSAYEAGRDGGGAPPLAPKRSFVVYDEALQDFVRLHNPERPAAAARPSQPEKGSMFSVDELD